MALLTQAVGRCMIIMHDDVDPTNEEWDLFLSALRKQNVVNFVYLIYTLGGKPSPLQREKLRNVGKEHLDSIKSAVVSDNAAIRFVVTGLSFFMPQIRAFDREKAAQALAWLEIPVYNYGMIYKAVAEMTQTLSTKQKGK